MMQEKEWYDRSKSLCFPRQQPNKLDAMLSDIFNRLLQVCRSIDCQRLQPATDSLNNAAVQIREYLYWSVRQRSLD